MKKFIILLFLIIFTSCGNKKETKIEEPEKDFLAVPSYAPTQPSVITYVPTTTQSFKGDSTYWYVVAVANNVNWHGTVELGVPYFDFVEARKQFEGAKGKLFFKFITQITKESYKSFEHYDD